MKLKRIILATLAALTLSGTAGYAMAHHSFIGQFDPNQLVTMEGTVVSVRWVNPHAFFSIEVSNDDGSTEVWAFELGSPNTLIRYNWDRSTLQLGDDITAEGYLARSGENLANAKTVTLADGTIFEAASSYLRETR